MLEIDMEELAEKNGKEGKPVYIAYEGKVYDVSGSNLWKTGTHMKRHASGSDLTVDMGAAPHGPEVLERYPQVAMIRQKASAEAKLAFLEPLFERVPFLRRHPHPMTVHFPIAFILAAGFFTLLYLATGKLSFETTAFHCLAAGTILTPFVILTGFTSWLVNYMGKPMRAVTIKMSLSFLLLITCVALFSWRAAVPDIITSFGPLSFIYLLLILSLSPMVSIIGWHGAKLTFPVE
ncbi:MAG: DUF2231 domain-containing protein [Syntrophobacteraceae bacterium]